MTVLAGAAAIVTGASSGIGQGLAEMLARHGVRVALAARRRTELERVAARIAAAGGSAVSVPTDVADDAQLHDLVDRVERELGPVDILVNAAVVGRPPTDRAGAKTAMNVPHSADDRIGTQPPTVSVGVPVYNGGRYLHAALSSLRAQTFTDFEVVVCDNASTDTTAEIAQSYQEQDARFRHVRNAENLGVIRNYRRALDLARGRYFKWLSSDDTLHGDYLSEMVGVLEADPGAVLCACLMPPIDHEGEPIPFDAAADAHISQSGERYRVWPAPPGLSGERAVVRFDSAVNELPGNMEGQFYYGIMRTEVVRQLPQHGLYVGAERVFLAELALRGRWLYIDRPLARRRIHVEHLGSRSIQDVAVDLDPQRSGRIAFPAALQLAGYLRAIHREPLPPSDRLHGYRSIARKVLRAGTWRSMVQRGPDNYFGWGSGVTER